jgi:NAD(P)-dependent dehydrogenase (short-subunit alcohol dehydrogenase family)
MKLFSLTGKKAVLLGGGGVLGAAMAKGLLEAGADVAICDLDPVRAQIVVDAMPKGASTVKAYKIDTMDIDSIKSTANDIFSDFGRADILVNAVGGNMKAATTSTRFPLRLTAMCLRRSSD